MEAKAAGIGMGGDMRRGFVTLATNSCTHGQGTANRLVVSTSAVMAAEACACCGRFLVAA